MVVHLALRASRDMVRFALLSGACWLLDLSLLLAFVQGGGWDAGGANIVSSLITAAIVYRVAHRHVHDGARGTGTARLPAYLAYTLGIIVAASWLVAMIVSALHAASPTMAGETGVLLAAKVIVTPPQFISNFFVSRLIARASIKGGNTGMAAPPMRQK